MSACARSNVFVGAAEHDRAVAAVDEVRLLDEVEVEHRVVGRRHAGDVAHLARPACWRRCGEMLVRIERQPVDRRLRAARADRVGLAAARTARAGTCPRARRAGARSTWSSRSPTSAPPSLRRRRAYDPWARTGSTGTGSARRSAAPRTPPPGRARPPRAASAGPSISHVFGATFTNTSSAATIERVAPRRTSTTPMPCRPDHAGQHVEASDNVAARKITNAATTATNVIVRFTITDARRQTGAARERVHDQEARRAAAPRRRTSTPRRARGRRATSRSQVAQRLRPRLPRDPPSGMNR